MRELRDLRAFRVDLSCLFGRHLRLERRRRRRLSETRDGPPPRASRVRWSALAAQRAVGTCRLGRAVHVRMYAVATIQQCVMSEDLSGRTSKAVPFGIVGKRAGQKLGAAALRIVFARLPALLPRSIEVHAAHCRRLHRRVIGVVAIGHDLLRLLSQRPFAPFQRGLQLAVIDRVGGRVHIHHQAVGHVGEQLHVVARHRAALTVSHHVRVRIGAGGPRHEFFAIVLLLLLQAFYFTHRRFQSTRPLSRRSAAACRWGAVSSSLSAFRMRTCWRASSRCASSFSLRRKLLPPALALILVPSSVTRSKLIRPSALSIPSTCTNKSSKAALFSERKPDSVRWLIACNPQSH